MAQPTQDVDFYDIYDYYTTPFWQTTEFYIGVGIATILLCALAIFLFHKYKKRPLSPWAWALLELKKISPTKAITKEEFKSFYFKLTAIIKQYLQKRYSWDTENKTDAELITWLTDKKFNAMIIEVLKKIADDALWIKYANMDVLKSQAEADWHAVMGMVEQTKETTKK